ncbi:hypothetical protein PoB_003619400 [Plakobranchus ocellatus]|uniref:Uncharacterized protein n=1 Tax=Plakobranchus ocellatus TaxID=259542 RepID=A0AAV4AU97_9GAST|nr:hypothetical protein PoB_003619400 [Plakobranchus ocellatus]
MAYHRWHKFPQGFRAGFLGGLPLNPPVWKKSAVGVRALSQKCDFNLISPRQNTASMAHSTWDSRRKVLVGFRRFCCSIGPGMSFEYVNIA